MLSTLPRKSKPLICQECGGRGGRIEPVLDFGEGPFELCGWCKDGVITPKNRGIWLSNKYDEKRRKWYRDNKLPCPEKYINDGSDGGYVC